MANATRPPGPKGHFLSGNSPEYRRDPLGFLTRCAREYGDIVALRFGRQRVLLLNHPDHVEHVLVTGHRNFPKYSRHFFNPLFGKGLFASEGDFWLRQRRLLQPAFQRPRLAVHGETIVALTERMLTTWHDGQTRDLHAEMMRLMLEIAAKTILGIDVPEEAHDFGNALEMALQTRSGWWRWLPRRLPTPYSLRRRRALRHMDAILYRLIEQPRTRGDGRNDLLSSLLCDRLEHPDSHMTDRQLRDEAMNIFIAGRETTALALAWSWYLLARHPGAMVELETELQAILGGRAPTAADLPQLRYTERVILESLRLFPPAYKLGREAIEDCEIGGYQVPAGTPLLLMPWVLHRDPRYFDNPDKFQPNRWADDLAQRLPKYAYFPFGAGPRLCIGQTFAMMNAVLVLATIAQQFHVGPVPGHTLTLWPAVTLRPGNGIPVMLRARRRTAAVSARATSASTEKRPRISLCMVVKNEENNLPSCLGSVAHLVDEIIVADTGSTDSTKEVAASFGARIVDFAWCDDFAAARNESQRHATGAWIFYLDGDEQLDTDNQQRLCDLFAGLQDENAAYTMPMLSRPQTPTSMALLNVNVRLFRNDPRFRWKYRAHPQIAPALLQCGTEIRHTKITIEHSGYQDEGLLSSKLNRGLRYLQLDNAEHPDDPFILFSLGFCHLDLGQADKAVSLLQRSLELADPRAGFRPKLFAVLARAQARLGQRTEALATLEAGLAHFADDPELLFTEGVLLAEGGNFADAECSLVRLLGSQAVPNFAHLHPGLRGYLGRHYLAGVYCGQGRLAEAEAEWRKALADWPNFTPAWRGLGELYVEQARWDDFARVIEQMKANPRAQLDAAVLQAEGHLAREEFSAARDTLEAVIAAAPQAPWPREVLSRVLLRECEDRAAAEDFLLTEKRDWGPGRGGHRKSVYWIHPREVMHPLCVRHDSSDVDVFQQIFVLHEYAPLYAMTDARLVIDCGANVGYSAACFLSRYPNCHVVAVEPDPENFAMLQRNLLAYGSRVTLVQAGVWSHSVSLVMSQDRYRDGREWAKQVRPCEPNEDAELEGVDIASLLASSGYDRISLLKMDVEGAEAVVFRDNVQWLDKVDVIAIELHDDSVFGNSSEIFFASIRGQGFEVSHSGELTICCRPGAVRDQGRPTAFARQQAPAAAPAGELNR